ncbi:DNA-directed RNA polymerase [Campylobacter fetus]|uniref:DNA-directed RNA polymerase n=1 Tax=Campylobacter fetus TaxID=196 RepID=UPI000FCCCF13|nr:DNA-directed RNA polymerase [Campylobacter fetus]RUT50974.1 hypothetical protein BWK67_00175 [Campylobacter fetus]RUT51702.1 hypothetical protein BWK51_00175 [Campylobacter fetus]
MNINDDINLQGNSYRKASLAFAKKEKLTDRGIYWLKVDIANNYGLDKCSFEDRVNWVDTNIDNILKDPESYIPSAEEPLLFKRAIIAYKEGVIEGKAIGHICQLDATASGPQIMSTVMRDVKAMKYFNVIGDDIRHDYYTLVAKETYNKTKSSDLWKGYPDFNAIRKVIKKPLMTLFYNSKSKPKEMFGDDTAELKAFYEVVNEYTKGAMDLMDIINSAWDDTKSLNTWRLPDGHTAYCPVSKTETKRIELKEINAVVNYMHTSVKPNPDEHRSLVPNIIHALDAWICRMIIESLHDDGVEVSPIHDSFGVHPNHCDNLRKTYRGLLARLYREDIIDDILSELTSSEFKIDKPAYDKDIDLAIRNNSKGYYIC